LANILRKECQGFCSLKAKPPRPTYSILRGDCQIQAMAFDTRGTFNASKHTSFSSKLE
jgi:hypothetical protein